MSHLLRVNKLKAYVFVRDGVVRAVDGVDLELDAGKTTGVVGESGSGKTMLALSIIGLLPRPGGRVVEGSIEYDGRDLASLAAAELRRIRGKDISMIFQEPTTSLNPVQKVGHQIVEAIRAHERIGSRAGKNRAVDLLRKVGVSAPEMRFDQYPHQLSGGMCQRVMIAIALACNPKVLIADEPTTALDVTIQAQFLDLLRRLQDETGVAIMYITHDLGVAAEMADDVLVMYCGQVLERAPTVELLNNPVHPYTVALLASVPKLAEDKDRLDAISGSPPTHKQVPSGCRFHPRCKQVEERCRCEAPPWEQLGTLHWVRCWLSRESRN